MSWAWFVVGNDEDELYIYVPEDQGRARISPLQLPVLPIMQLLNACMPCFALITYVNTIRGQHLEVLGNKAEMLSQYRPMQEPKKEQCPFWIVELSMIHSSCGTPIVWASDIWGNLGYIPKIFFPIGAPVALLYELEVTRSFARCSDSPNLGWHLQPRRRILFT